MRKRGYVRHELISLRSEVYARKRRGRSLVDRRSMAGKNAMAVQAELIRDLGGPDIPTAKLLLIELISRDVYFVDECDQRILRTLKDYQHVKNPQLIHKLYSYRSAAAASLSRNLALLGLERAQPKEKTLQELLAEDTDTQHAQEE